MVTFLLTSYVSSTEIEILAFYKDLGFVDGSHGTTHEGPLMVVIPCKNSSWWA